MTHKTFVTASSSVFFNRWHFYFSPRAPVVSMASLTCVFKNCCFKAKNDAALERHLIQHDPVAVKQNTCEICNIQAVNSQRNRQHYILTHGRFDKVCCPGCQELFQFPKQFDEHLRACAPRLSELEIRRLVENLPPVNPDDGKPNTARMCPVYLVRKRGAYKNTKKRRSEGTAVEKAPAPTAAAVRTAAARVHVPHVASLAPPPPPVKRAPVNVKTRQFRTIHPRPMSPPAGLLLRSDLLQQQQKQQPRGDDMMFSSDGVWANEEILQTNLSFDFSHAVDPIDVPVIPEIDMTDLFYNFPPASFSPSASCF